MNHNLNNKNIIDKYSQLFIECYKQELHKYFGNNEDTIKLLMKILADSFNNFIKKVGK